MMLLRGAEVRLSRLPRALLDLAQLLLLAHGVEAARRLSLRGRASAALPDIGTELLGGCRWAVTAFAMFSCFESQGRRSGAFDRL